jgi:hypothetical protein
MNDLLHEVRLVITKEYQYKKSKNRNIILTEDNKQASCREVIIKKSGDILVYKFDKEVSIDGNRVEDPFIFLSSGIARSKCDFILFYPYEKRNSLKMYVFVCNLKSKNLGNNFDQLNSGEIFAEFLIKTVIRCFNHENAKNSNRYIFKNHVKIKNILFANLPFVPKGLCKPKEFLYHKCSAICDLDALCN